MKRKTLSEQWENRYRVVTETISEGIAVQAASGEILTWNKGAEEIFGLTEREVVGQTSEAGAWNTIHEDGSPYPGLEHPSMRTLITGQPVRNEIMGIYRPSGELRWISINTNPLFHKGQRKPYAVVVSFTDITEIKKEKDLSQMYLDVANVMILALDATGSITLINKKGSAILGYSENELLGKNWFDTCLPEEQRDGVKSLFSRMMKGELEGTESVEEWVVTKSGEQKMIAWKNTLIRDGLGEITGSLSSGEDITEKRDAEIRLQELAQALTQAQRVAKIGSWWYCPETRIPVWTDEIFRIFGLEPRDEAPDYASHQNFIHPDDWEFFDQCVTRAVNKGIGYDIEVRIIRPDGQIRHVSSRCGVETNDKGQVVQLIGTIQDITDRIQAEQEIHSMAERLDMATRAARLGIWDWDVASNRLVWDDGMFRLYGMDKSAFTHDYDSWTNSLHPDDRVELITLADQALRGEREFNAEFRVVWADGTVRVIKAMGQVFWDSRGKPLRMTGINYDITEKKELESRIQQSQKMEAIGNLAGGVAHDFNNILFPILGMAELVLEDLTPGSQVYENAREILKAGKRGRDLVQQILAFSRQSENILKPIRAQRILNEALRLIRSTIPANIEISRSIQEDCGLMMAEPTHIHQVVMNLITNAFHAVEAGGGSIDIRFQEELLSDEDVTDKALSPGRYAHLSISDTGTGIPEHVLGNIFDPYFTTKENGKGTGLGLAVVYGIVKDHKGEIQVESTVGEGTTFHVYFPLMDKTPPVETVDPQQVQPIGNERILLVDDEEPIVRMERQMLERLGYQVTTRVSSIEALAAFKANPESYDVVISDMSMPQMTGVQMAREMNAIRPDIPIIVCTGFSERIDMESARDMGIKGFLMKPVVRSELSGMVRKVLDEGKKEA